VKVLVLLGGTSNEREVSLRSGKAVEDALKTAGHSVSTYDPADGVEGLSQFVGEVDCVFPILHGAGGEDGSIQKELEKRNFKYLGSDSKASKLYFNKDKFKELLNESGILTPKWEVVDKESVKTSRLIKNAYVLKPIGGGSTIDAFIVRDPQMDSHDRGIFNKYERMLLEELIEGDEVTVPVLGNKSLPVIEIIPPKGREFDYENKYNGATQELCPPKNVSSELQLEVQKIAENVHQLAKARHLSRSDFMINPSGKIYALELNTIPGLTDQSLFPKSAGVAGLTMPALVNKLVKMTMQT